MSRSWKCLCLPAVVAASVVTGCTERGGPLGVQCEEVVLTGAPARIVEGQLQMPARAVRQAGGQPVRGLEIEFGLQWQRSGSVVDQVTSDSSGSAVGHYAIDDLRPDAESFGALQPTYSLRWTGRYPIDGVSYCEADGSGPLPLQDLPEQ